MSLFTVFECIPMELMKKCFEVNYFGTVRCTKAVIPYMKAKESGHLINISSHAGVVGFPTAEIYSSTKFAVEGLTESMAPTLRQFNIRYFVSIYLLLLLFQRNLLIISCKKAFPIDIN